MKNSILFLALALLTTACGSWQTKMVGQDYDTKGGEVKWPTNVRNAGKYEDEAYSIAKNYCGGDYKVIAKRNNKESESVLLILDASADYEYIHFKCTEGNDVQKISKK